METLSERLRTRFEMGLPVDIQIPTYETKMAIINRKAEISGLDIPYEVSDYVATHIKSSIRELEGALTKLSAFSTAVPGFPAAGRFAGAVPPSVPG